MPRMKCTGWWEQAHYGRQPMSELLLDFENGRLAGTGTDIVGAFEIVGELVADSVVIRKQYIGKHMIEYLGRSVGEGVYEGNWNHQGFEGGRWCIRFVALDGELTLPSEHLA